VRRGAAVELRLEQVQHAQRVGRSLEARIGRHRDDLIERVVMDGADHVDSGAVALAPAASGAVERQLRERVQQRRRDRDGRFAHCGAERGVKVQIGEHAGARNTRSGRARTPSEGRAQRAGASMPVAPSAAVRRNRRERDGSRVLLMGRTIGHSAACAAAQPSARNGCCEGDRCRAIAPHRRRERSRPRRGAVANVTGAIGARSREVDIRVPPLLASRKDRLEFMEELVMTPGIRRVSLLALVTVALAAAGCAVNPVTGKHELTLVTARTEAALGARAYIVAPAEYGVYGRCSRRSVCDSVGRRVARASELPDLPWRFTVLDDPVVNAFRHARAATSS